MALFRHLIEHLIPLIFGAILGWLLIGFRPEHAEWWVLAFVLLFAVYTTIVEALKRYLFFLMSRRRKICGIYAEIYVKNSDSLVVAPFLVLHELLRGDELRVLGRAFVIDAQGHIQRGDAVNWTSTAISLSEPSGSTRELAYLFAGLRDGSFNIHGTTRVGVPAAVDDRSPRRGYFIDTDIKEPAFGAPGNKPFGPIEDLANHVDAVRFFSVKFDAPTYQAFVRSCDSKFDKLKLWLQLFCEPSETVFRHFLVTDGLKFLAACTPGNQAPYQDISRILNRAAAPGGSGLPTHVASDHIEGSG